MPSKAVAAFLIADWQSRYFRRQVSGTVDRLFISASRLNRQRRIIAIRPADATTSFDELPRTGCLVSGQVLSCCANLRRASIGARRRFDIIIPSVIVSIAHRVSGDANSSPKSVERWLTPPCWFHLPGLLYTQLLPAERASGHRQYCQNRSTLPDAE